MPAQAETVRLRPRPAHTPGTTILAYTPDGRRLVTAGSDSAVRIFTIGSQDEPLTVDEGVDGHLGIAALNDSYILGAEDGTVWKHNLQSGEMETLLIRSPLPIRDLCLSKDGEWVAVASDELVAKIVNVRDMHLVKYLREQTKGAKHVSFDAAGRYVAVSCSDGVIYIYSFLGPEPDLIKKIDGVIRKLETDSEITSRVAWHPDGRAFAAVDATREVAIVSTSDWTKHNSFKNGHDGDITALAWSPNGAFLATAGTDGQIVLWDTSTQSVIKRYSISNVNNLSWHPIQDTLAWTTTEGELFMYDHFVPAEYRDAYEESLVDAPLRAGSQERPAPRSPANGQQRPQAPRRAGTPDSLDDILGPAPDDEDNNAALDDGMEGTDNFVDDDDDAGYGEPNRFGKRRGDDDIYGHDDKRKLGMFWEPKQHEPFQPGSTPWRGGRRYLCLNLIGCIWSVQQEEGSHNTITVEFYDREQFRDFHFTDPYLYDKACLNDKGALFSCQPGRGSPATVFYRPHETWTIRTDWHTQLPEGESITAIALSESYIVVTTSTDYVRVYTLYGTPYRVYRQKSRSVTCAAWKDYVMTVGNGAIGGDGVTKLNYSIENVKTDEICQNEDVVALPKDVDLQSVMFSDNGDPCIYDTKGVLLVLQHWRTTGHARWVPLLDTRLLERLQDGRRDERYWPVAVAQDLFYCIILKSGDRYPYFPRPLLSEFEFQIPLSTIPSKTRNAEDEDPDTANFRKAHNKLEESFVRTMLVTSLLEDRAHASEATSDEDSTRRRNEVEIDKILLQLLAMECREGEERGMKALELVTMFRNSSGKMLEAASKIAQRYERTILDEKIRELAEKRLYAEDNMSIDDEL